MDSQKNLHLLWRSGFGPGVASMADVSSLTTAQLWQKIKGNIRKAEPIVLSSSFVQDNYDKVTDRSLSPQEKGEWNRRIRFQGAKDLREMNGSWIGMMVSSDNQLLEKMSFFWHHHFAIRHPNSFLQQDAINIIRQHALGNFCDLLRQVSKSGAMILSLNNQQNKRTSPNENFAREIMELFAMGIGNYTEQDIKEAARAFTGWSIGRDGRFALRREQHDTGIKNILGQRGNFDGDDVVDIILKQPQTSRFIVTKLYRFLVNETPDQQRIEQLAASFRKDYEILNLLDLIFTGDWFYDPQNMSAKVKTPVELLVGAHRFSPFETIDPDLQMSVQKLLGQVLFHPPSIAGWPTGKNWMDSSTLMVRLQLPQILSGNQSVSLRAKSDDDVNMGRVNHGDEVRLQGQSGGKTNSKWDAWAAQQPDAALAAMLLIAPLRPETLAFVQGTAAGNKKALTYGLMSLPEYQLC